MADKSSPGESGTTVGQIKTPMCSENVGRGNTPSVEKFKDMPSGSGGASIYGPGTKPSYKGGA